MSKSNIKHRMQYNLHSMYRRGKGMKKSDDPEHKWIHANCSLNNALRHAAQYADWLQIMGVSTHCTEQEAAGYVQQYADYLVDENKSPSTIHTYIWSICKALGVDFSTIRRPSRSEAAPQKGRDTDSTRLDQDLSDPQFEHLVQFASRVLIRRDEYAHLRGGDIVQEDGKTFVIVRRGKGGKKHYQFIMPEDADFVASYFAEMDPEELIFTPEELDNKLNLHKLRREGVQARYWFFVDEMMMHPDFRETLKNEIRLAFERAGEDWRSNEDMQKLDVPYICRGNVRTHLQEAGKPVEYDRTALMAVSVLFLAHWRCDVTVHNYMM